MRRAEPQPSSGLTLAQLERLMQSRRNELARLVRDRARLQRRLEQLEAKIAAVAGAMPGAPGTNNRRARNAIALQDLIHQILAKAAKPLSVSDILERVTAAGYRSHSANFRGIVNQTLIKDKRFVSTARGIYQLKH